MAWRKSLRSKAPPIYSDPVAIRDPPSIIQSITDSVSSQAHSHRRQETSTTYQPTTGHIPYGCPDYKDRRDLVAKELGESLLETRFLPDHGTSLLDSFFPNKEASRKTLNLLKDKGKYGVTRFPVKHSSGRGGNDLTWEGWINWPNSPPKGEKGIDEKDIAAAFILIFNAIIRQLGLAKNRVAVDRQAVAITCRDGGRIRPDVFLWGKGTHAFPPIDGTPSSIPRKAEKKRMYGRHDRKPAVDWPWCVIPIEIKTEKSRGATTNRTSFYQLGTYVREVLAAQEHRRFVPSLLVTERTVEFLLWDRAGVVVSERVDYHEDGLLLCHMLATIVTWNDIQLGFDPTLTFINGKLRLRTQSSEYVIQQTLFRAYTLRGRGSTCWLVSKPGSGDLTYYIVQDSWVEDGMTTENIILRKIEELRSKGDISGVLTFIHMEEVAIPGDPLPHPDTIRHNRHENHFLKGANLVHTRTISRCHSSDCRPLENFRDPEEIVSGLYDVIRGLKNLYEKAKIIHRDIVPWNILIQPGASVGFRGVLIDFSCATFTNLEYGPIYTRPETTPGSHIFRSRESLSGLQTNLSPHLGDVESCYYLLCFLIAGHTGPNLRISRQSFDGDLHSWETVAELTAYQSKIGHFLRDFVLPVQDWFGEPINQLAANLHRFFQQRLIRKDDTVSADACKDFQDVMDCLYQAMRGFKNHHDIIILADMDTDINDPKKKSADWEPVNPRSLKRLRIAGEEGGSHTVEIIDHLLADGLSWVGTSIMVPTQ